MFLFESSSYLPSKPVTDLAIAYRTTSLHRPQTSPNAMCQQKRKRD